MTPAQEFRQFILTGTRGKEVISPTLLMFKLESLIRQEQVFTRDAYYVGHRDGDFNKWYKEISGEENTSETL